MVVGKFNQSTRGVNDMLIGSGGGLTHGKVGAGTWDDKLGW